MSKGRPRFDKEEVRRAVRGDWSPVFAAICELDTRLLDGKHHPCPQCGGEDRFRCIDKEAGALYCNQCFRKENGDGFDAIEWLKKVDFTESLRLVAECLGVKPLNETKEAEKEKPAYKEIAEAVWSVAGGIVQSLKASGKDQANIAAPGGATGYEYPTSATEPARYVVVRYDYTWKDKDSQEVRGKEYRPFYQSAADNLWRCGDPPNQKFPLYNLPAILAADPSTPIYLVEGEKCADALIELGLLATTSPHGSRSVRKTDWTPLAGRSIVGSPDNDQPGEDYIADALRLIIEPTSAVVKRLPGLGPKEDAYDWITARRTAGHSDLDIFAELESLATISAAGVTTLEYEDDPHRLARINLDRYASHAEGATIRYWRDEFYTWKAARGCYRLIRNEELRAKIGTAVKEEFDRIGADKQVDFAERSKTDKLTNREKSEGPPRSRKVTRPLISNVVDAMKSLTILPSSINLNTWVDGELREQRRYIAMRNGILDLANFLSEDASPSTVLLPPSPGWFSMVRIPYEFSPDAKCERWKTVLDENMEGDEARINILQEFAGYCLLAKQDEAKFLILEGDGSNGKTVYLAGIEGILGFDNCSFVSLEMFGERFQINSTLGKLANICGDVGELDKVAEGHIKQFTDGNPMQFERKNASPFEAVPTAKLLLACNNLPRFSDKTDGIWRRIILVPWRVKVDPGKKVKGMKYAEFWREEGELPGMFAWALEGLVRLLAQGDFTKSDVCNRSLADYQQDSNPTRSFFAEALARNTGGSIPTAELYAEYRIWCEVNGYRPTSERTFGKDVVRTFPWAEKKRIGARGDRFYTYPELCYSEDYQPRTSPQSTEERQQEAF